MQGYRGSRGSNYTVLVLLLLLGGLVGSALTSLLAKALPILAVTQKIGLQPTTVDLGFIQLTLGLLIAIGPVTALGIILGYLVYRLL